MKYTRSLDGLRAVAVVLVLLLHAVHRFPAPAAGFDRSLFDFLRVGWIGVDIFFVLSGYLITSILLPQRQVNAKDYFTVFYARRSLRIFPLYFSYVLLVLTLLQFSPEPPRAGDWASLLTYTQNFYWVFRPTSTMGWIGPTWTLAVEEHFYLLWPLVIRLFSPAVLKRALPVAILGILALRICLVKFGVQVAVIMSTPTRIDSLLIGGLFALYLHGAGTELPPKGLPWIRGFSWLSGLIFLAVGVHAGNLYTETAFNRSFGFTLVAIFAVGIIAECLHGQWFARALSHSALVRLGKISYGVYLVHLPVMKLLAIPFRSWSAHWSYSLQVFAFFALSALFIIPLCQLSFQFFEKPILSLKRHFEYTPVLEETEIHPAPAQV